MGGSFVCSLVVTDVCTGRTEAAPMLAREQSLVAAGLEGQLPDRCPFPSSASTPTMTVCSSTTPSLSRTSR